MSASILRPFLTVGAPRERRAEARAVAPPPAGAAKVTRAPLEPGQAQRFRELLLPHMDAAYGFARYLTRDPAAAEDLVQEAYLSAYRAFGGFRGGDPRAWLFAILRSRFMDQARRKQPWGQLSVAEDAEEIPDPADTPEAQLLRAGDEAAVREAVDRLPDPFREAIVLRELQEMSYRAIAEITGAPIGTVMSRLARARRMLAASLDLEARS